MKHLVQIVTKLKSKYPENNHSWIVEISENEDLLQQLDQLPKEAKTF